MCILTSLKIHAPILNPARCIMPLNDAQSLQETRLCGKLAHTHRTIADVVCGLCADCAATLDADTIEDAAAYGLAVRFNSKSVGSRDDLGAYFDRARGEWTAPRYEIIDVGYPNEPGCGVILHRAITREDAIAWLITFIESEDAAN